MATTIDYYNTHAKAFFDNTKDISFTEIQDRFLSKLFPGAFILDFGCGSGRDTKYFLERGYAVDAMDGSEAMCRLASACTGISVRHMYFEQLEDKDKYDGIWACSSILHLDMDSLTDVLKKMAIAVKTNGIIYTSFKYGAFSGMRNGRYFTDITEETAEDIIKKVESLMIEEVWISSDVRPGRSEEKWLNLILRKIR